MVTENSYYKNEQYLGATTLYGLSTDDKPVTFGNGSIFIEIDTGDSYMFDAENSVWYPVDETDENEQEE